ncbi:hypothetical protein M8J76_003071 [Diaphorina citri]|nr:hypothetical protein M8J75_011735 [Diaphorina citri]KAI5736424.1 hypothetical protein M8J76_003071 [Diaphorina citri]KAI5742207.1 hypothetical protein M8J77_004485 [Diaphorina citri]
MRCPGALVEGLGLILTGQRTRVHQFSGYIRFQALFIKSSLLPINITVDDIASSSLTWQCHTGDWNYGEYTSSSRQENYLTSDYPY